MLDTRMFRMLARMREVVPYMKRPRRGAVATIGTRATRKPFAGQPGYAH